MSEWFKLIEAEVSPLAMTVYLYLRTGPLSSRLSGLVTAGAGVLADDLHEDFEAARRALSELQTAGLVLVDPKQRVVYLPGNIERDLPGNPNQAKGMAYDLARVPDCTAAAAWLAELHDIPESDGKSRLVEAVKPLQKQFLSGWPEGWDKGCVNRCDKGRPSSTPHQPTPPPPQQDTACVSTARAREGRVINSPGSATDIAMIAPTEKQLVLLHDKANTAGVTLQEVEAELGVPLAGINVGRYLERLAELIDAKRRPRATPKTFQQQRDDNTDQAVAEVMRRRHAAGQ